MENENLANAIKELVEQISVKEISTRDFVTEMKTLYTTIQQMEYNLKTSDTQIKSIINDRDKLSVNLENYKKEYVIPAQKYKEKEIELKYEHLDWKTEKKYLEKECVNLKAIISSLTARKVVSSSDGNGSYKNEIVDKPILN